MNTEKIFFVAGASGMAGSAIVSELFKKGYKKILTPTHSELNFLDKNKIDQYLQNNKPDHIILCAAKVGGILANQSYPADFIYENIAIQTNIIHSAFKNNIRKNAPAMTTLFKTFNEQEIQDVADYLGSFNAK